MKELTMNITRPMKPTVTIYFKTVEQVKIFEVFIKELTDNAEKAGYERAKLEA